MTGDDAMLLRAWAEGDAAAGNALVERHFASLYRFVRAKIDVGVDDLLQQVFLAMVESAAELREPEHFKSFLFGVARRRLLLHWRAQRRRGRVIDPDADSVHSLVADGGSPSAMVAALDERDRVIGALRSLPIDYQIVVELHYWESMGVREIAEVVQAATGTVKSRLARARAMLAERLGPGAEHDLGRVR